MTHGWTGGQYSIFRAALGVVLLCHAWAMIATGDPVQTLIGAATAGACVLLIVGWFDRVAAGALAAGTIILLLKDLIGGETIGRSAMIESAALGIVALVLVAHLLTPSAPYGSLKARGRPDPDNGWRSPGWLMIGLSITLALGYTAIGLGMLWGDPAWRHGQAMTQQFAAVQTPQLLTLATWLVLAVYLAYAPLFLVGAMRRWLWFMLTLVNLTWLIALRRQGVDLSLAHLLEAGLLAHLLAFNPTWIAPLSARLRDQDEDESDNAAPEQPEMVYYDGYCGLCHCSVRFVLAEDRAGRAFRFSPLQGEYFARHVPAAKRVDLPDSIIVCNHNGDYLVQSAAIAHLMMRLGGLWRVLGVLLHLTPRLIRDNGYRFIASIRRSIFKKPEGVCPMIPPDLRGRFEM